MAEEISKPLSAANKVTMVSSGGSEIGAAKLTGEVLDIMTRLPETIEKLTGVTISQVKTAFQTVLFLVNTENVFILIIVNLFCSSSNVRIFAHVQLT